MKRLLLFASVFAGACSHVDTGEIDYRRADTKMEALGSAVDKYRKDCLPDKAAIASNSQSVHCDPMLPTALMHKNVSVGAPIRKDDYYSIRLEQAVINHLLEAQFSFRRLAQGKPAEVAVGEVVVLANAFEFAGADATDEATKTASFMFTSDPKRMKVVYYSSDVENKQTLNFSNIPLKVESKYGGRPVGIQITVIELDRLGSQLQSLLRTLADLGTRSNAIPGGEAGALLAELGTSLMTGSHDDMMFDYIFVLDPAEERPGVRHAAFEEGRYVLRRLDTRGEAANWRNLTLDLNTGKLWHADQAGKFVKPYVQDTYFTINVVKHAAEGARSKYALQTMEELSEELEEQTTNLDRGFETLDKGIQAQARKLRSAKWDAELITAWDKAQGRYLAYAQAMDPGDMTTVGCTFPDEAKRKRAEMALAAKSAAIDFIQMFHKARLDTMGVDLIFPTAEQRQLLTLLGGYFLPDESGSPVTAAELMDPDAFAGKYTAGGAGFYQAMDAAALQHWRPKTCADSAYAQMPERVQSAASQ